MAWTVMALKDAFTERLVVNKVGSGTDMAPVVEDDRQKSLFQKVENLYRVLVVEQKNSAITLSGNKNTNKRQCRQVEEDKVIFEGEDRTVSNLPQAVKETIAANAESILDYWYKNVIPLLDTKKERSGKSDTFLRTAVICLVRCCVSYKDMKTCSLIYEFEHKILNKSTLDPLLKDILDNKQELLHMDSKYGSKTTSPELAKETIEALYTTVYNHWTNAFKLYQASLTHKPVTGKKYASVIHFIRTWRKIVKAYVSKHNNVERDLSLKNIMKNESADNANVLTIEKMYKKIGNSVKNTNNNSAHQMSDSEDDDDDDDDDCEGMDVCDEASEREKKHQESLYPINTPVTTITGDYIFKVLLELVLSPHIHPEWKIPMCDFVNRNIPKLMKAMETDISNAVIEVRASKVNPVQILPIAANFWDFCKSGKPPSDVKFCMMFNEPSSNETLSSGAGVFGRFIGGPFSHKSKELDIISNCLRSLLLNKEADNLSTRIWREGGSVVCFNYCPITARGAVLGYGEQLSERSIKALWAKKIQDAVTESVKRQRNAADKNSRNCDLLGDEGVVSMKTVTFGCANMLKTQNGMGKFNVVVSFEDSIQANKEGAARQYMSQQVFTHSFPALDQGK
ncbi:ORF3 [White spot syndrome virus]|uniref:Wsv427 n=5 Tax=White spot syndrome virus TaxID=342409 RepID=Q77J02_WSSVS